jgi:hypothetical protein
MKIMGKNLILISAIILFASGCSNRESLLMKYIEKENEIGRIILEETKEALDEKHPEFKDINEVYYNRMIAHDELILRKLTYVLTNHPERVQGILFSVPIYDLKEEEEKGMLEDPIIKKLTDQEKMLKLEYDKFKNQKEYWKYRGTLGGKIYMKYQTELIELGNDLKEIEKLYNPPNKKDLLTPPSSGK